MSLTETERTWFKETIRDYYPEEYCRIYGQDQGVASNLTKKQMKAEAKSAGIRCFNTMENEEIGRCLEAKRSGNQELVEAIEARSRIRMNARLNRYRFGVRS